MTYLAFPVFNVTSPRISLFLHSSCGFVKKGSRYVRFLMPFAGELMSRWVFSRKMALGVIG